MSSHGSRDKAQPLRQLVVPRLQEQRGRNPPPAESPLTTMSSGATPDLSSACRPPSRRRTRRETDVPRQPVIQMIGRDAGRDREARNQMTIALDAAHDIAAAMQMEQHLAGIAPEW